MKRLPARSRLSLATALLLACAARLGAAQVGDKAAFLYRAAGGEAERFGPDD